MIKFSELKAARAAMTPGDWDRGEFAIYAGRDHVGSLESTRDAVGVVATHNAADTLIAITEAALAYTRQVETEQDARDKEAARRSLIAALAKVSP